MIDIQRNVENVYLTEAWDVFEGPRFLGTVVWRDGHWSVALRGGESFVGAFDYRLAAIDFIVATASAAAK